MSTKFNSFLAVESKRIAKSHSNIEKLSPIVVKWEGGFVNDPIDKGGATNMGVTLGTWKLLGYDKNGDGIINDKDIELLNTRDFSVILKKYWDKWKASDIKNQSIANILVDWYWCSGKWGIVIPQRDLFKFPKEDCDGIVGNQTLSKLNSMIELNPKDTFDKIYALRVKYLNDIVNSSVSQYEKKIGRTSTEAEKIKFTQKRFLKGWLNRLKDFKYSEA